MSPLFFLTVFHHSSLMVMIIVQTQEMKGEQFKSLYIKPPIAVTYMLISQWGWMMPLLPRLYNVKLCVFQELISRQESKKSSWVLDENMHLDTFLFIAFIRAKAMQYLQGSSVKHLEKPKETFVKSSYKWPRWKYRLAISVGRLKLCMYVLQNTVICIHVYH